MNYFPFHVGDYAAHTAHLSWEEDIAYRRMLDVYYLHEKPLPADTVKVARLIRMPKAQRAVDDVLAEFFVLADDGWRNKRADDEIASMLLKQGQQAAKDGHETDRMRRYRERRAEMFAALRVLDVVPAWDVSMKELQRLHDVHCNAPVRVAGALPETDEQRLSLPTPTPTPTPKKERESARGSRLPPEWTPPVEHMAFAESLGLRNGKATAELAKFRDYWAAQPGQKGVKTDWPATWRNWCRRATEAIPGKPSAMAAGIDMDGVH